VAPGWFDGSPELRKRVDEFKSAAVAQFEAGDRVAKLPGDERPHVWMVDTGGFRGMPEEWYLEGLRAFVNAAAREPAAANLLVVPFVGAGLGGKAYDKGGLLPLILEALAEEASRLKVDVAFVARDRRAFAAAQALRRRTPDRYWPTLSEPLARLADRLGERAAGGSLVAFFGAGTSRAAGLPSWTELLHFLAIEAALDEDAAKELAELPLVDQALILERRLGGPAGFRERIVELVHAESHTLTHALLAGLPATEFVTTNYDELFELAAQAAGMPVVRLPYEPVTSSHQRWLLKLHGTAANPADIVLTREDYLRYPDRRGALAALVQALLITRHMLFVGFSLGDDNFHRIVDDVRKALGDRGAAPEPFGTALMVRAGNLTGELWRDDLEVVALEEGDVSAFLDRLLAMSSLPSEFLLDDSFTGFLTPEETRLKTMLSALADELGDGVSTSDTAEPIRRLLESYGASRSARD